MALIINQIQSRIDAIRADSRDSKITLIALLDHSGEISLSELPAISEALNEHGIKLLLEDQEALTRVIHNFFHQHKRIEKYLTMKEIGELVGHNLLKTQLDNLYKTLEILEIEIVPFLPSVNEIKKNSPTKESEERALKDGFEKDLEEIQQKLENLNSNFTNFTVKSPHKTTPVAEETAPPASQAENASAITVSQTESTSISISTPEQSKATDSAVAIKKDNIDTVKPSKIVSEKSKIPDREIATDLNKGKSIDSEPKSDGQLFGIVRGAKISQVMDQLETLNAGQGYITLDQIKESRRSCNARYIPLAEILTRVKIKKLNLLNISGQAIDESNIVDDDLDASAGHQAITSDSANENSTTLAPGVHLNMDSYNAEKEQPKAQPDFWDHVKKVKAEQSKREPSSRSDPTTASTRSYPGAAPQQAGKTSGFHPVTFFIIVGVLSGVGYILKNWNEFTKPEPALFLLKSPLVEYEKIDDEIKIMVNEPATFSEAPLRLDENINRAAEALKLFKSVLVGSVKPFLDKNQLSFYKKLIQIVNKAEREQLMREDSIKGIRLAYERFQKEAYQHMAGENIYKLNFYFKNYGEEVKQYVAAGDKVKNPQPRFGIFDIEGTSEETGVEKGSSLAVYIKGRSILANIEKIDYEERAGVLNLVAHVVFSPKDFPYLYPRKHYPIQIETSKKRLIFRVPKNAVHFGGDDRRFIIDEDGREIPINIKNEEEELSFVFSKNLKRLMKIKYEKKPDLLLD